MTDLLVKRTAVVDGPCRYALSRQWDERLPMAAWLLCNPSTADDAVDDPTCRRMAHFTRAAGCGGFNVVNIWPGRTPRPAELWKWLSIGGLTKEMDAANALAIEGARLRSDVLFVGFGPEPARRDRARVMDAIGMFSNDGERDLLCLGLSPEGWPLHPLARGKFAIPNGRVPTRWEAPAR